MVVALWTLAISELDPAISRPRRVPREPRAPGDNGTWSGKVVGRILDGVAVVRGIIDITENDAGAAGGERGGWWKDISAESEGVHGTTHFGI